MLGRITVINQIQKIKNEDGRELKDIKDISRAFVGFYQTLFTAGHTQELKSAWPMLRGV
jgi:hypothetical protein